MLLLFLLVLVDDVQDHEVVLIHRAWFSCGQFADANSKKGIQFGTIKLPLTFQSFQGLTNEIWTIFQRLAELLVPSNLRKIAVHPFYISKVARGVFAGIKGRVVPNSLVSSLDC